MDNGNTRKINCDDTQKYNIENNADSNSNTDSNQDIVGTRKIALNQTGNASGMRKSGLRHGMLVVASDHRFGLVCMGDASDEECIKFFYNPEDTLHHGLIADPNYDDFVVPLDKFTDDLKYVCSQETAKLLGIESNGPVMLWSITAVYDTKLVWERKTCVATCQNLHIMKESVESCAIGKCRSGDDERFVGNMEDIHCGICPCIGERGW